MKKVMRWQQELYLKKLICDSCFHKGKITCDSCLLNVKEYVMSGEALKEPEVFCECCQNKIERAEDVYEDRETGRVFCMPCVDKLEELCQPDETDLYED
jgi:hypothetical protein